MKVFWSYVAIGNIIENNRYIAKENPETARRIINEIYEAGNRIKQFPEKGRIILEIGKANIREVFSGSYRIIDKLESKRINILTVRHMRQDLRKEDL